MNLCMIYVNRFRPIIYYQIKTICRTLVFHYNFGLLVFLTYGHFIIQAKGHVTSLFSISIIAILFSQFVLFLSYKV